MVRSTAMPWVGWCYGVGQVLRGLRGPHWSGARQRWHLLDLHRPDRLCWTWAISSGRCPMSWPRLRLERDLTTRRQLMVAGWCLAYERQHYGDHLPFTAAERINSTIAW